MLVVTSVSGQIQERTLPVHAQRFTAPRAGVETGDTLGLPFVDDFSYPSSIPTPDLWQDAKVWVNDVLPLFQNSIGVASFDGLNEFGFPYAPLNNSSDTLADVLTSRYLDLQGASNVWLSFQYQPAGQGESPTSNDSLVVEFYSPVTQSWSHAWGAPGNGAAAPFKTAMIPVQGTDFLQKGFAFRIGAYGARSGAYDVWNVDYVQLDADRNASDSTITEPAMARPHPLIAGNGLYTSWPWWLSMSSNLANRPSNLTFTYRRLGAVPPGGWSLNLGRYTWRENGALVAQQTAVPVITNTLHNQDLTFDVTVPSAALGTLSGPTTVETKVWFDGSGAGFRSNDTVRGRLELDNYLALDDGNAERAYGIENVVGGRVAQRFRVDGLGPADSLMGVRFQFVQNGAPYTGTFRLAVWAPGDTGNYPGTLLYMSDSTYSANYGFDRGDWIPFALDSALSLANFTHIWIGYIVNSANPLWVGLDRTRDLPSNLPRYYGDGFQWFISLEPGVLLMQPYFRYQPTNMVVKETPARPELNEYRLYPNPASTHIRLDGWEQGEAVVEVRDVQGRLMRKVTLSSGGTIDISTWPIGWYSLRIQRSAEVAHLKFVKS